MRTIVIDLSAILCAECVVPLANAVVRLYAPMPDTDVTALAVARAKDTYAILDDAQIKAYAPRLLAEAKTDARGWATVDLSHAKRYEGGPVEVCVLVSDPTGERSVQLSLTTLQPRWRKEETGERAAWQHNISTRAWAAVLSRLCLRSICGVVTRCATGRSVGGVVVRAFDRDWLQDDALGSAVTGPDGHFHLVYTCASYRRGTWLDLELVGGPDLYFRVETSLGVALLAEPPSLGRTPGRENVGSITCVTLCLPEGEDQPDEQTEPQPVFTHIGGYHFLDDIASVAGGDGKTSADDRAFYSDLRLNGNLARKLSGAPLEYSFQVRETNASGAPLAGLAGTWRAIVPAQMARLKIGVVQRYAPDSPTDPNAIKTHDVFVNGGAGELSASLNGPWIQVPQGASVFGPDGYFAPNGNLISLVSTSLTQDNLTLSGLVAGASVTSTGVAKDQNRFFGLQMRVRAVGDTGIGAVAGECTHVAIENVRYDQLAHHPSWAGFVGASELAVGLLEVAELVTAGCMPITDSLHVNLTAAHPNLGAVSLSMTGPGGPYGFTLPPVVDADDLRGVATLSGVNVADLPSCAYIITLSVGVLLTTGDSAPLPLTDQVAFCKD